MYTLQLQKMLSSGDYEKLINMAGLTTEVKLKAVKVSALMHTANSIAIQLFADEATHQDVLEIYDRIIQFICTMETKDV